MKLVVTEKNNAADRISQIMSDTKPKLDKVYNTQVYRFTHKGEEWVTIGLRGHILAIDYVERVEYTKKNGWVGIDAEGNEVKAPAMPDKLPKPPYEKKKRPFLENGVTFKGWMVQSLPYMVYAPVIKTPAEKDIIRSLKNLAKKADSIVIATDFDREGELIGSDAVEMIREVSDAPVTRARYSALTKGEITKAFDNLVELDYSLAQAGDSRREIDLIWGAVLTRYLTKAKMGGFGDTRPAGRVQTPTLALVVEREKERLAFVPEDYWVIKGTCENGDGQSFVATHKKDKFKDEAEANAAFKNIESATSATVSEVEKKTRKVAPPTPFNTTTLQMSASSIGLTPARVMRIAESLYMSGYISYPRVDNTVYPNSINLAENVKMLGGNPAYAPYTAKLLAKGELKPTRGKMQTTDHPPIHPVSLASEDKLRPEEWKLYNLIARRFLATLSDAAVIEATKLTLDVGGEEMVARGDSVVEHGFREIYPFGTKKEDELPIVTKGEVLKFKDPELLKKQTEPPSRYSQAKLILEMEKLGLGTKSTRASIIERLQYVRYVQNNPVEPTMLGMAVIDALGQFAPRIVSPTMTSELEDEMTHIAEGQDTLERVVNHSRDLLDDVIEVLIPKTEDVGNTLSEAIQADAKVGTCPKCGKDLQLKSSAKTKSKFIGCAGWPDCDVVYPVPDGRIERVDEPCPECGKPQIKVTAFRTKPKIMCIDPNCPTNFEPKVDVGACSACAKMGKSSRLIAQKNPKTLKRFIRCENYEECNTSYPLPRSGEIQATDEVCESCGAPMVIVVTRRGPWKLCPNMDCPSKAEDAKSAGGAGAGGTRARGRKSAATSRKGAAKAKSASSAKTATKSAAGK